MTHRIIINPDITTPSVERFGIYRLGHSVSILLISLGYS